MLTYILPFPVAHRELWLAIKGNCACHLAEGSVNRRHIIAAAIEGKYALAVWIIQNPIRILACRYLLQNRARLQVEYYDDVVAAIANEAPVEIIGHSDAVYAFHPRDFGDWLPGSEIHYRNLRAMRHVELPVRRVHSEVIPAAFAVEWNSAANPVLLCAYRKRKPEQKKSGYLKHAPHMHLLASKTPLYSLSTKLHALFIV
jgi:hypothetical protein